MKKAFSLTALLALCGLGVGVLASCQEIPATYIGGEVEEEHTHSYTGSVTKEATCTEEGVLTYTCECGDSYTEPIAALGHDYTAIEYVVIDEAEEIAGWYYVCSRCGEVGEVLEDQESPLAGGEVVASTAEGLGAALEAANSTTGEEVIITLTGDIETEGLTISGSNITLTGEGELTLTDSLEVSGSDVTLDGLTIDATGVSEEEGGSAAVKVTGDSTTISDCTIVGGGEGTYDASILVVSNEENESEVDISGCDISGAYRGVFINGGKNVDLSISDCEIHSVYAFSKNGNDTGTTISVSNSKLYGWTSFAAVGEASFTDCIFGFAESEATTKVTGGFKPYSDVTLTGCYFSSFNTSGIILEGDQANDTKPYLAIESNNFGLAVGKDNVKITLISCTYEQSLDDGGVEVATVYEENVINLMYLDNFTTYSNSGFVFSLEEQADVWTLGAITQAGYGVPTGGDEGGD